MKSVYKIDIRVQVHLKELSQVLVTRMAMKRWNKSIHVAIHLHVAGDKWRVTVKAFICYESSLLSNLTSISFSDSEYDRCYETKHWFHRKYAGLGFHTIKQQIFHSTYVLRVLRVYKVEIDISYSATSQTDHKECETTYAGKGLFGGNWTFKDVLL